MAKCTDQDGGMDARGRRAAGGTKSFPRAGSGGVPKALVVTLCEDELYRTDGTSTYIADLFDLPQVKGLGPMIKQLRVHWVAESASANFRGKVTLAWSVLGRTWSTPVDVITALTGAQTGTIGAWYTTDANFGLQLRFAIEVSNSAGTAVENARVTAIIEIELKS